MDLQRWEKRLMLWWPTPTIWLYKCTVFSHSGKVTARSSLFTVRCHIFHFLHQTGCVLLPREKGIRASCMFSDLKENSISTTDFTVTLVRESAASYYVRIRVLTSARIEWLNSKPVVVNDQMGNTFWIERKSCCRIETLAPFHCDTRSSSSQFSRVLWILLLIRMISRNYLHRIGLMHPGLTTPLSKWDRENKTLIHVFSCKANSLLYLDGYWSIGRLAQATVFGYVHFCM